MFLRHFFVNCKYLPPNLRRMNTKVSKNLTEMWKERFEAAKIEDADFCIKTIVAYVLNRKLSTLCNTDSIQLSEEQIKKFEQLCECRMARMPLQYIIGEWDFADSILKMVPPVFIPRLETEGLVQLIVNKYANEAPHFLEVGCGSGAICLSILKAVKNSTCLAIDRSIHACNLTTENAKSLNLIDKIEVRQFKISKEELLPNGTADRKFDFIVSNPPYIKTEDLPKLAPEILYENVAALDGGPDGLKVARNICQLASLYLKIGGRLWMELDSCHPPILEEEINLTYGRSLSYIASHDDIFGKKRFVEIIRI